MPRRKTPQVCHCGCGEMTRGGEFIPGHDAKLLSSIVKSVGGIASLRDIVEEYHYQINIGKVTLEKAAETTPRKVCPECGHVFLGSTWGGIDAHWRAHHEHIMPYEDAWPLIRTGGYTKLS